MDRASIGQVKKHESDRSSVDRRSFFRQILLRGLEHLEEAGQELADRLEEATRVPIIPSNPERQLALRPPGALPEPSFEDTCSRCGQCVEACPAQCIVLDPQLAGGLPHIQARQMPCVVCEELACMNVCPTGALKLVERHKIDIGVAVVDHQRCLRGPDPMQLGPGGDGEDCQICVEACPFGDTALQLNERGFVEVRSGCTGCGVCEHRCPTEPTSILVEPKF